ncbi:MAG: thiolase family protein [Peptococcaceae bacterium]|nr:thiolase family protein [Peptococcaceae bacterium]
MEDAVIVSAVRTAVGRIGGSLKDIGADHLAALVIKECLGRAGIPGEEVGEVIMGQTKQSTDAPNLARVAALRAGIPVEVPAYTVHRQCGSGLQAVNNAVQQIMLGLSDVVIAGGVESMSTAPYYLRNARFGYGAGNGEILDPNTESQPKSQPEEIYGRFNMGLTAENLAELYKISRAEQDQFALASQEKAWRAIESGFFKEQIVPVTIKSKKGESIFDTDEHPRKTTLESLSKLPPAFKQNGTVTAGNSSGRNDGAAALVLMSGKKAREYGLKPVARVVSQAAAGVRPEIMGIGPVPATRKALQAAGLELKDIGLIELNEAFAAQSLACIKELGLDMDKVNPNGGAIALGHPLGATGAILMTKLVYELARTNTRYGLAALCIAGGLGIAAVVENLRL